MVSNIIDLECTIINDQVPSFIYEGLQKYYSEINKYSPQPTNLVNTLARKHNVPIHQIFITAGVDQALRMFIRTYGDCTYVFSPTYIGVKDVTAFGKTLIQISSLKKGKYNIETNNIPDATLFILNNPNNPCGYIPNHDIELLAKNNPQAIIVVDQAYADFMPEANHIFEADNIANLRSFSKGYALAGMRVGYIIASPHVIEKVKTQSQWAAVSYLSVGAALIALEHEEYYIHMRNEIIKRKDEFITFLKSKNYQVIPGYINAVLLKLPDESACYNFVSHLKEHNIKVSQGNSINNIGLDDSYVRIAIGTTTEMNQVMNVIDNFSH